MSSYLQAFSQHANQRLPHAFDAFVFPRGDHGRSFHITLAASRLPNLDRYAIGSRCDPCRTLRCIRLTGQLRSTSNRTWIVSQQCAEKVLPLLDAPGVPTQSLCTATSC